MQYQFAHTSYRNTGRPSLPSLPAYGAGLATA